MKAPIVLIVTLTLAVLLSASESRSQPMCIGVPPLCFEPARAACTCESVSGPCRWVCVR
jgi:hypothetical protein